MDEDGGIARHNQLDTFIALSTAYNITRNQGEKQPQLLGDFSP